MTRRVRWQTRAGTNGLDRLAGVARLTDRDVTPVTAALRDLQSATGSEVVSVSGLGRSLDPLGNVIRRHFLVLVHQAGQRRRVLLTVEALP